MNKPKSNRCPVCQRKVNTENFPIVGQYEGIIQPSASCYECSCDWFFAVNKIFGLDMPEEKFAKIYPGKYYIYKKIEFLSSKKVNES